MRITLEIPDAEYKRYRQYYEPWIINENKGAVAQLEEHVLCKHEVAGSIPVSSIKLSDRGV